jgi:hemoglobin-like flavoprotein
MNCADIVMQSFGRCCASNGFFDTFYVYFLSSSAEVRGKFADTDMTAQKQLLRHGILNLVMHARGMPDRKLRALGCSHARGGLDIRPELYDVWLDALLKSIGEHDLLCNDETRLAWREVLNKGISVIKAQYDLTAAS